MDGGGGLRAEGGGSGGFGGGGSFGGGGGGGLRVDGGGGDLVASVNFHLDIYYPGSRARGRRVGSAFGLKSEPLIACPQIGRASCRERV